MCITMAVKVPETLDFDNVDQNLASESITDETLVSESAIDETLVSKSEIDETLFAKSEIDETLVSKSEINETLVAIPEIDQTLVADSVIDLTLGRDEPVMELNHSLPFSLLIKNNVPEPGPGSGSDESSSGSSFKSIGPTDEEKALAEDYDSPEFFDSEDNFYCMQGYMWGPHHPWGPHQHPWDPPCHMWGPHHPYHSHSPFFRRGKKNKKWNRFYENTLEPDLGEVDPDMVVGSGLRNLGNTCFLNAILQCFTHTVPLVEGLRSYDHPKHSESDGKGFCVFCALLNHIELAISSDGKSISPSEIVDNLKYISSDFRRYQQEDAHELLQCLLDKLERSCNNSEIGDSDENLVNQLFGGRLVSKLKCCNCGHCSDTFESLIDLSLEIENMSSLPIALESFTKLEKIEDEKPQFICEGCKEKVAVEKQLMVDQAPSIAAFHLKRFKNDGPRVEKIDKHVEFPLELDLKPYTNGSQDDKVDLSYNLYAIVVHAGFLPTSGHYFCYMRSAPDKWYRLDDSQVTKVSEFHVLSREAYILFYAKNGTKWFSDFMDTEKLLLDLDSLTTSPKSVLETANQSSGLSPSRENNIITEVCEEDRMNFMMGIPVSSNNNSEIDTETEKNSSSCRGDNFDISDTSPMLISENTDQHAESYPTMETSIISNVSEDDRRDAVKISNLSLDEYKDKEDKANDDSDRVKLSSITEINSSNNVNKEVGCDAIENSKLYFDGYKNEADEATDDSDRVKTSSVVEINISNNVNKEDGGDAMEISKSSFDENKNEQQEANDHSDRVKTSSITETNICNDVNDEDVVNAMEIVNLFFNNCGQENGVNEAKKDSKTEKMLSSSVIEGDNSDQRGGEFTEKSDFNASSPIGISRLAFEDCTLEDKDELKIEKKMSSSASCSEVGNTDDVYSSTLPAKRCVIPRNPPRRRRGLTCKRKLSNYLMKEALRRVKGMPCPLRRSQLMEAESDNHEVCFENKRIDINEASPNCVHIPGPSSLRRRYVASVRV